MKTRDLETVNPVSLVRMTDPDPEIGNGASPTICFSSSSIGVVSQEGSVDVVGGVDANVEVVVDTSVDVVEGGTVVDVVVVVVVEVVVVASGVQVNVA